MPRIGRQDAELADDMAHRPVPDTVRLKAPSQFRLIGKRVRRLDSRTKCNRSQRFGIDVDLPGMKVALVARPPVFGGRVQAIDDKDARAIEGVRDLFEIPPIEGSGVAIVADRFWAGAACRGAA